MTDDRIAELLGWPRGRANRDSSLMHRIRLIVAEAQAEQSAQIERMRAALTAAREIVSDARRSFYESHRWPDGSLNRWNREALNGYDALLRQIDAAMGETNDPR